MEQRSYYNIMQCAPRAERPERLKPVEFQDEEEFHIQSYTKSELAALYGVSQETISLWIIRHEARFQQLGYRRNLRRLDPAMIKLFVEIFSTP